MIWIIDTGIITVAAYDVAFFLKERPDLFITALYYNKLTAGETGLIWCAKVKKHIDYGAAFKYTAIGFRNENISKLADACNRVV